MSDFFKKLSELTINTEVTINITNKDGFLSMTVQTQPSKGNVDSKTVPYMVLCGPAAEVDDIFFKEFTEPEQQQAKTFSNAEEFKKDLSDVKSSKPGKTTSGSSKKKVEKKKGPSFEDQLKKADDLFVQKAWKKALPLYEKLAGIAKDKKHKETIKENISTCKVKIKAEKELKNEKEDPVETPSGVLSDETPAEETAAEESTETEEEQGEEESEEDDQDEESQETEEEDDDSETEEEESDDDSEEESEDSEEEEQEETETDDSND